jgi:hypothetical protein
LNVTVLFDGSGSGPSPSALAVTSYEPGSAAVARQAQKTKLPLDDEPAVLPEQTAGAVRRSR